MAFLKVSVIIILLLIIALIIFLFIKGNSSRSGTPPSLIDGKLTQCSRKPNCVCSEYKKDTKHYINPIILESEIAPESLFILKNIIVGMGGRIYTEEKNYLSSQFSSSIFGFVDDLEIRIDTQKNIIHLRSSSRVGTSDVGVNKKRINTLKKLYKEKSTTNS